MLGSETSSDFVLTLLCYTYIVCMILLSGKVHDVFHVSPKASRKFLHAMIGNLPFVIPFFASTVFPVLVAAPFILVTFLATPYSPFRNLGARMKSLAELTEEGHNLGLVFYAVSYTFLALLFASKPYIIAAGILPMAYGDSAASLIGEKWGKRKYKLVASKSLEGSLAMFLASLLSFGLGLVFFSSVYSFPFLDRVLPALVAVTAATLIEALSPLGFDNLTVPVLSALTFFLLIRGN